MCAMQRVLVLLTSQPQAISSVLITTRKQTSTSPHEALLHNSQGQGSKQRTRYVMVRARRWRSTHPTTPGIVPFPGSSCKRAHIVEPQTLQTQTRMAPCIEQRSSGKWRGSARQGCCAKPAASHPDSRCNHSSPRHLSVCGQGACGGGGSLRLRGCARPRQHGHLPAEVPVVLLQRRHPRMLHIQVAESNR